MYYITQTNHKKTTFFLVDRNIVSHKWWTKKLDQAMDYASLTVATKAAKRLGKGEINVVGKERAEFLVELNELKV